MFLSRMSAPTLLLSLFAIGGCSESSEIEFGTVSGVVHVDGEPAPAGLQLEFDHVKQGVRGSTAVTDDSGNYEAVYSLSRKGVRLGECVIKLVPPTTAPPAPGQKRNFPFPEEYYDAIRQVEINSGHQTIDLEISKKRT